MHRLLPALSGMSQALHSNVGGKSHVSCGSPLGLTVPSQQGVGSVVVTAVVPTASARVERAETSWLKEAARD